MLVSGRMQCGSVQYYPFAHNSRWLFFFWWCSSVPSGVVRKVWSVFRRDEEMDGEWEAPQIPNPACEMAPGCGTWKPPMVNNPHYKGKWKAPLVDNPNFQVNNCRLYYTLLLQTFNCYSLFFCLFFLPMLKRTTSKSAQWLLFIYCSPVRSVL